MKHFVKDSLFFIEMAPKNPWNSVDNFGNFFTNKTLILFLFHFRVEQAGSEESDLYRVECIFDADVPCAVRIFLMATEDLGNGSAK